MNELKPCPFCGGEPMLYHQSSKYTDYDGNYVYCMNCGCRTKLFECFNGTGKTHEDTKVEAIEAWNRRKRAFIQRLLCRIRCCEIQAAVFCTAKFCICRGY